MGAARNANDPVAVALARAAHDLERGTPGYGNQESRSSLQQIVNVE